MVLNEKFEVKFKDKNSAEQKSLLTNAIIDLYKNFENYEIIERGRGKNDQTSNFMNKFYITKFDILNLLDECLSTLNLAKYGDILADRDRMNNLLYILYIPNANVGNWDYKKSREKLLYIKWNPINKKIISFHTMADIQQTNRDELEERKMKIKESNYEIYNTHIKIRYGNRNVLEYYDSVSNNLFIIYDGYIETIDQIRSWDKFEDLFPNATLVKDDSKVVQIWKRDRKLKEKLSFAQLKSEVVPQSKANANLKYFYTQRNELNGQGNRNIKFLESQFDENDGSMLFAFRTDATYNDEDKKELNNDNLNDGSMKKNTTKEYMIQLKICDFFDIFYELIEPTDTNFSKEDMKAILELSEEVRIGCDCPSSYWMGGDYWLTQIDAQLKTCTIAPKYWNRVDLRGETKVCKHELSLLNHISFFLPQMAMACKKELRNYNLI